MQKEHLFRQLTENFVLIKNIHTECQICSVGRLRSVPCTLTSVTHIAKMTQSGQRNANMFDFYLACNMYNSMFQKTTFDKI